MEIHLQPKSLKQVKNTKPVQPAVQAPAKTVGGTVWYSFDDSDTTKICPFINDRNSEAVQCFGIPTISNLSNTIYPMVIDRLDQITGVREKSITEATRTDSFINNEVMTNAFGERLHEIVYAIVKGILGNLDYRVGEFIPDLKGAAIFNLAIPADTVNYITQRMMVGDISYRYATNSIMYAINDIIANNNGLPIIKIYTMVADDLTAKAYPVLYTAIKEQVTTVVGYLFANYEFGASYSTLYMGLCSFVESYFATQEPMELMFCSFMQLLCEFDTVFAPAAYCGIDTWYSRDGLECARYIPQRLTTNDRCDPDAGYTCARGQIIQGREDPFKDQYKNIRNRPFDDDDLASGF